MYFIPWSHTFPCIDAFSHSIGHLQMTINLKHNIARSHMIEHVNATKEYKLYFVVPAYLFDQYRKQKFVENTQEKNKDLVEVGLQKKKKGVLDQVKQFVICISID
jgi:hypothetical protein